MVQICLAEQFIYPVASIDEENVLVVCQKNLEDVELLLWNPTLQSATRLLNSLYLPSQVQLLPDKDGFSFIDKGRIRIKRFQKRAPRSIDIVQPINSIVSMSWINNDQFYFTGKHIEHYKVFLCDLSDKANPEIFHISNDDEIDYLYSKKIEDNVFYIGKDEQNSYHLITQKWNPQPYEEHVDQPQNILFTSDNPLCFLHMKNSKEGYFLKCNINESGEDELLSFTCYQASLFDTDWWSVNELFSFRLPLQYLMGESVHRVYESIYPFLPTYKDQAVFYVNYDKNIEKCLLYKYDLDQKKSETFTPKKSRNPLGYLTPLCSNQKLYEGLIVSSRTMRNFIKVNEENGEINIDLSVEDL